MSPLFDKDRAKAVLDKKKAAEGERKYSVLLIDDEVENLNVLAELLRDEYVIHVAESGSAALELIRDHPVDLIITDQRMPGMTGVQFLEHTIDDHPDAIRMILTGFTDVNAIIDAINSGQVYRYITKPWDEGELRITIRRALEKYELQRENRRLLGQLTEKNEALTDLNQMLESKVEERTRQAREAFTRFMDPAVARKVLAAGEGGASLASVRKNLTIFFSDLRGFSSLTDSIEPEEICHILNRYFTEMTSIISKHEGTLDKFIGDAIMVFFNDPVEQADHAERAVRMAIEMQARMKVLESEWVDMGLEDPLSIGMGIATGYVSVGNFGSEERMDYTIIGNQVNLAARLQAEADGDIIISHRTYVQIKDLVECEALEPVQVKGFHQPVKIYRVGAGPAS